MTPHTHDQSLFLNRELSWLAFNERVLEEAADVTNPLLERVKFVAIAASNLDEFFMVRVAGLKEAVEDPRTGTDLCGMTPLAQLTAVGLRAHEFVDRLYRLALHDLLPALDTHGVRVLAVDALPEVQRAQGQRAGHALHAVASQPRGALVFLPRAGQLPLQGTRAVGQVSACGGEAGAARGRGRTMSHKPPLSRDHFS